MKNIIKTLFVMLTSVSLLSSAGSFDYSEQLIENHINRALIQLNKLPQSIARDLMSEVAKRSRSRKK